MHKDSSGNVTSSKGEEVKIVSRFLAPLCARDETARNIALAAARNTVEGWLGEVSSPIHQENDPDDFIKSLSYKRQEKRYDGTITNSALDSPLIKIASNEDFSPEKSTENIWKKSIVESSESFLSGSFDCLDGRFGGIMVGYPSSSDNTSGFKIGPSRAFHQQDGETRFRSISESDQQFCLSHGLVNDSTFDEKQKSKNFKVKGKVKGSRQKQLEDDTELDVDRIYGKSPKFDDDFGYMANRRRNEEKSSYEEEKKIEGVMFNTLEGFKSQQDSKKKLEFFSNAADEKMVFPQGMDDVQDYLCYKEERKCSAGQIKGLLLQDENGPFKSDRVLGSAEVSPGDVGRMLNLGNALDGPRLAQANKYLTLVSLHLPVILRLSVNCPFQNVRIKCAEILEMVKVRGLQVPEPVCDGPSAFVPTLEFVTVENTSE